MNQTDIFQKLPLGAPEKRQPELLFKNSRFGRSHLMLAAWALRDSIGFSLQFIFVFRTDVLRKLFIQH